MAVPDLAGGLSSSAPVPMLFISSNGAGMGHLTRLMAMAQRASATSDIRLLSMSQAVGAASDGRLPYQYVPSVRDLGISPGRWNRIFRRRLETILAAIRPTVVVFDGAYPYAGLIAAMPSAPGSRWIWSRRGMWKPGLGMAQLRSAGHFDVIIQPGEVAASADRGLTSSAGDAVRVPPVVLVERDELLDRNDARRDLGLDPDREVVLVTLGAGNLRGIESDLHRVVSAVTSSADRQVCLTQPFISLTSNQVGRDVVSISTYPLARYLRAFDFAVSTAGYNSFHESMAAALPTAFVANTTQLDDQGARARWAEGAGAGVFLDPHDDSSLARAVHCLANPARRGEISGRCAALWQPGGALRAMREIERIAAVAGPGTA